MEKKKDTLECNDENCIINYSNNTINNSENDAFRSYKEEAQVQVEIINKISTIELFEALYKELEDCVNNFADLFPSKPLSDKDLSKFLVGTQSFISSIKRHFDPNDRDYNPNYRIRDNELNKIIESLSGKLGENSEVCIALINRYKTDNSYNALDLIEDLRKEISLHPLKVAKTIPLKFSQKKLSYIFAGNPNYIAKRKNKITSPSHDKYNPNWKPTRAELNRLRNLLISRLTSRAFKCLEIIKKFEKSNPDLLDYENQQYHLANPELDAYYFEKIDTLEKAYWLGFIWADATVLIEGGHPFISLELQPKDEEVIVKFAKAIGLSDYKIQYREKLNKETGKYYKTVFVQFSCRPMWETLRARGFTYSTSDRHSLPFMGDIYLKFIATDERQHSDAIIEYGSNINPSSTDKLWLVFLLGYYDGDGISGSTAIVSSSKNFLIQVKTAFKDVIPKINKINPKPKGKSTHKFSLGPMLLNSMMLNYKNSLQRKRPVQFFRDPMQTYINLKKRFDKNTLQKLVWEYPKYKLTIAIGTSLYYLDRLIEEYDIDMPPSGYWKSDNN